MQTPMITLANALMARYTPDFERILKHEIEGLDVSMLPLQEGLMQSSFAKDGKVSAIIINVWDDADNLCAKAGIFYAGLTPGCSCADDPTPDSENVEYCELLFTINKSTAETEITLI